jgi:predicted AAA+ superfamily ATPase
MAEIVEKKGIVVREFKPIIESSFFLFGPRGVGKSHWIKSQYQGALLIDLLKPGTFRQFLHNPEHLEELVLGDQEISYVVIDEVQKIPELLNVVHSLMEADRKPLYFILSGSSTRKLKSKGVDLLGGRALIRNLHPFLPSELGEDFDFERALKYGLIPLIWNSSNPAAQLKAYIGLYLKEEVKAEGLVKDLSAFSHFLETMSLSQAQQINSESIARDVHVDRKSVLRYIEILEDLYLAFQISVFSKRAQRDLVTKKKFYFFDCGLYRLLRPKGPLDKPSEIDGHGFETLIAQCLRAHLDYQDRVECLWFWRTTKGEEIDFVIYDDQSFIAIEVKNSNQIRAEDLKSLSIFGEDYPEAKLYLIYRGNEVLKKKNILCLPGKLFLTKLRSYI